jgi:T-complex protein 1 subunit theta
MAMHFIEKYGMMALRIPSKFDMRRFCRATDATALTKLQAPGPADLGRAKRLAVQEIGGVNCVVLQQVGGRGSLGWAGRRAGKVGGEGRGARRGSTACDV